mmetsp:Transcript_23458/g.34794  ORF Transcript_23458/g.34794 Transcript_23458/m.34794 type:complete len:530 (+) Transcript_23458:84-1673(+)
MKLSFAFLSLSALARNVHGACPFSKTSDNAPDDNQHRNLRRRLASLSEGETRDDIAVIIKNQQLKAENNRSLQTACMTQETYDDIQANIAELARVIRNDGDRGHFFGGIVRLAAHDFMDFDRNQDTADDRLGSDGCLDFSNPANAGLPDLWCDNPTACPFKALYDTSYATLMSRADFWVAAANAVVAETSVARIDMPFRYGRIDRDDCPASSSRLPEPGGCSEVQATFIDRMGVSWRDAVALLGAHTLGRGDADFSGHAGTWVQSDAESTIFDKGYFDETVGRGWFPRRNGGNVGTDWTWGGNNRGVMMLNIDICLRFDIPEGDNQNCCTNTNQNCRGVTARCDSSAEVRPDAFNAFEEFRNPRGNRQTSNDPFYRAYETAWKIATENGYPEGSLRELADTCGPPPTSSPTASVSPSLITSSPSASVTISSSPSTEGTCSDVEGTFPVGKKNNRMLGGRGGGGKNGGGGGGNNGGGGGNNGGGGGNNGGGGGNNDGGGDRIERDCEWVIRKGKCSKFGEEFCPASCGLC